MDLSLYKVISASRGPNKNMRKNWRIFEKEALEKYFGPVLDVPCDDGHSILDAFKNHNDSIKYIRWYADPELTNKYEYEGMIKQNNEIGNLDYITSSVPGFVNVQSKEICFKTWEENNIRCPKSFVFESNKDFYQKFKKNKFKFPVLLRINNSVAGEHSYLIGQKSRKLFDFKPINFYNELKTGPYSFSSLLNNTIMESRFVNSKTKLDHYLDRLDNDWEEFKRDKRGIETKKMCVELIDTVDRKRNVNISFRVHVSGDKVISGYARTSNPDDWVAIMGKFDKKMSESWLYYNKLCEKLCVEREEEICQAVHVLGLNHQGVDFVLNQNNNEIYFLEVQPTYATGYTKDGYGDYNPPFFNPSYPKLVKYLIEERDYLESQIPRYYSNWLDKENHFDLVYKCLREYIQ